MKTLKVLSLMLNYPTDELVGSLDEMLSIIKQEGLLDKSLEDGLEKFTKHMKRKNVLDLQEEYTELFDRTPSLCLNMFEHVYRDSRDRGQALSDLVEVYKESGLFLNSENLPDYLPLFLEYLSILPKEEALKNLGGCVDIVASLALRLNNRKSVYAFIFESLQSLSPQEHNQETVSQALKEDDGKPFNLTELDKQWEEQMAFENTSQTTNMDNSCPQAREMVAKMHLLNNEQKIKGN